MCDPGGRRTAPTSSHLENHLTSPRPVPRRNEPLFFPFSPVADRRATTYIRSKMRRPTGAKSPYLRDGRHPDGPLLSLSSG